MVFNISETGNICHDNDPPLNTDNGQITKATCIYQDIADSHDKLSHRLNSQDASIKSDNLTFNHSKLPVSTILSNIYPEPYVTLSGRKVKLINQEKERAHIKHQDGL
jgi:hypothetical protein